MEYVWTANQKNINIDMDIDVNIHVTINMKIEISKYKNEYIRTKVIYIHISNMQKKQMKLKVFLVFFLAQNKKKQETQKIF